VDYLKIMVISTKDQFVKIFTDHLFYVGGVIVGYICYLTGLTTKELMSAFILILCDIASRVWAEKVNKRAILSKKMYSGFVGKIMAYAILFIAANHAFYIGEYLKYVFLSGFGLIEIRSIYENLKEAKQKHLVFFEDKILQEEKRFKEKKNEDFKK